MVCGDVGLLALALGHVPLAAGAGADSHPSLEYTAADKSFSARVPAYWKVDEVRYEKPGASFFGFGESISVSYHRATDSGSAARQHLLSPTPFSFPPMPMPTLPPGLSDAKPKPNRPAVAGHEAWEASTDYSNPPIHNIPKQQWRKRTVVVVMKNGFFSLQGHCLLPGPCTWEAFETFLASFQPGRAM